MLGDPFLIPEVQAAIERGDRGIAVAETARKIASSDLDDVIACRWLRARLSNDRDLAREVAEYLAGRRTTYLDDRAYRLLNAVLDDTSVRPIDAADQDQFLAEAQLGRRSLTGAFEELAALEPRLRRAVTRRIIGSAEKLVGPWADSPHMILNTELAASVVVTYRSATKRGRRLDADSSTPFFARKDRVGDGRYPHRGASRPRPDN